MSNPLYDNLFGIHAGKRTPFLKLLDGAVISHSEFLAMSAQIAHVLTQHGLAPGDRVAVQVSKSPEALALYAACVQSGLVFIPLNTAYTVDEVSYFIENSGAPMIVCDSRNEGKLTELAENLGAIVDTLNADGGGLLMEAARVMPESFSTVSRTADDLAAFLYTSGTTGR